MFTEDGLRLSIFIKINQDKLSKLTERYRLKTGLKI